MTATEPIHYLLECSSIGSLCFLIFVFVASLLIISLGSTSTFAILECSVD